MSLQPSYNFFLLKKKNFFLDKSASHMAGIKFYQVKFLNSTSKQNNLSCAFNFITVVSSASDLCWKPLKWIIKYQQTQVQ